MSTLPEWAQDQCAIMPSQSHQDWLHNRRQVISGTDISSIMGVNPYKTRFDLWLDKTNQLEPIQDNEAMRIGRIVEPGLRIEAERQYGSIMEAPGCLQSNRWPIMGGTPDGLREGIPWIFEFKTAGIRNSFATLKLDQTDWGDEQTDQVPANYLYQCMWYMGLTGADQCQLIALIGNHGVREYTIERDQELIEIMVAEADKFWRDHVEGGEQPAIEYSSEAESWIKRRYPNADKSKVLEADAYLTEHLSKLAHYKAEIKDAEAAEKQIRIEIMEHMGDAYKLTSEYGSVTMPEVKGRASVDWKALAEDLKISEMDIARYTRIGKPTRQFRFTPSKK